MKLTRVREMKNEKRRAPHGARGLKYSFSTVTARLLTSRPAWGAWIEIDAEAVQLAEDLVAPRMGRVD